MRAGQLRHRVTIQRKVAASPQQTAEGEPDTVWTDYFTDWMAVEPLAGRELFAAQEHQSEVSVRIRMRYRSDVTVTAAMRAVFESAYYDIKADPIDVDMHHRELILMCTTGVNQG